VCRVGLWSGDRGRFRDYEGWDGFRKLDMGLQALAPDNAICPREHVRFNVADRFM
jgi:hypothetical protein